MDLRTLKLIGQFLCIPAVKATLTEDVITLRTKRRMLPLNLLQSMWMFLITALRSF